MGNRKPKPKKAHPQGAAPSEKKVPKTPVSQITPEQQIVGATFLGKVVNYYSDLKVIALILEAPLSMGDHIRIKGHTTDLSQRVDCMQVDHLSVQSAAPGESVAVEVADKARPGDAVYKV